jgi:uncharacterized surface protein with fasciclin (FAS1) repeats
MISATNSLARILCCSLFLLQATSAFQTSSPFQNTKFHQRIVLSGSATHAEDYIAKNFPTCYNILSKNNDVMKKMNKAEKGFTIFAPNESAFKALGDKKSAQLKDVRNEELVEKIAAYHCIAEPVTADKLFNSGGVVTLGGEVPAERSVSGGLFGVGGKEDGGIKLNGSKVVNSSEFVDDEKTCIVHEMDGLISPTILWRYADQLRIPGSS